MERMGVLYRIKDRRAMPAAFQQTIHFLQRKDG